MLSINNFHFYCSFVLTNPVFSFALLSLSPYGVFFMLYTYFEASATNTEFLGLKLDGPEGNGC